jgi:hypothetical protein
MKNKSFEVRVTHKEHGFQSFYTIETDDYDEAERKAKLKFMQDFCNAETKRTDVEAYVIDRYKYSK